MKPVALLIKDLQSKIVTAINESNLPPSVVEAVINAIHTQITAAAQAEIAQAEKEYKEEGEENAESN